MKKHPVDELFQCKLRDLEKTPSANAWERIEVRTARRKGGAWVWYAAASVAVGLFAGYLVLSGQQDIQVDKTLAKADVEVKSKLEDRIAKVKPTEDFQATVLQKAANVDLAKNHGNSMLTAKAKSNVRKMKVEAVEPIEPIDIKKIDTPQPETLVAEIAEVKEPKVVEQRLKVPAPNHSQSLQPSTEPTRTIMVAVETSESEKQQKPSKFARVFRQLRNAQAGERVDWEEVGFRPKDLFAKADDRTGEQEERSTEKRSPKDRADF